MCLMSEAYKLFFPHIHTYYFDSYINIRLVKVRISFFFFLHRQTKWSLIYSSAPPSYSFLSTSDKIHNWTWQSALQAFSMQGVCVLQKGDCGTAAYLFFFPSKPISIAVVWVTPTPCPYMTMRGGAVSQTGQWNGGCLYKNSSSTTIRNWASTDTFTGKIRSLEHYPASRFY